MAPKRTRSTGSDSSSFPLSPASTSGSSLFPSSPSSSSVSSSSSSASSKVSRRLSSFDMSPSSERRSDKSDGRVEPVLFSASFSPGAASIPAVSRTERLWLTHTRNPSRKYRVANDVKVKNYISDAWRQNQKNNLLDSPPPGFNSAGTLLTRKRTNLGTFATHHPKSRINVSLPTVVMKPHKHAITKTIMLQQAGLLNNLGGPLLTSIQRK